MDRDELLRRLSGIEWDDFECKEARGGIPRSSYETVSAFSNTFGGWLVFGVADHGNEFEIVGAPNPDQMLNGFLGTLRNGQKFSKVYD